MSDLIRRQDAIDAVRGRFSMPVDNLIVEVIGNLPSAQPTVDAVAVVRCKECKHRFVDGENVRFNCCELNHNKVQADDWFCADGKRKDENRSD